MSDEVIYNNNNSLWALRIWKIKPQPTVTVKRTRKVSAICVIKSKSSKSANVANQIKSDPAFIFSRPCRGMFFLWKERKGVTLTHSSGSLARLKEFRSQLGLYYRIRLRPTRPQALAQEKIPKKGDEWFCSKFAGESNWWYSPRSPLDRSAWGGDATAVPAIRLWPGPI